MFLCHYPAHHRGLLTVAALHLQNFCVYAFQTFFTTDSANRNRQVTIGANKQQRVRESCGHRELREAPAYAIAVFRQEPVRLNYQSACIDLA